MLERLGQLIACAFERHMLVRRLGIFLLFGLLLGAHLVVYWIVWEKGELTTLVVAVFSETLALTGVLTAWYMQMRKHEDGNADRDPQVPDPESHQLRGIASEREAVVLGAGCVRDPVRPLALFGRRPGHCEQHHRQPREGGRAARVSHGQLQPHRGGLQRRS